jgi:hypothetical protein
VDHLTTGLYVLTLIACCVSLWLWYEIDAYKDYIRHLRLRMAELEQRMAEIESKRR